MAGLVMADEKIWQETVEQQQEKSWVKEDKLLNLLFEIGLQVNFSYEALLESVKDEATRKHLASLYFSAKYRFAEDGVVEYAGDELRELVAEHIDQYQKELHKNKLHSIMKEIKSAEEIGDKEALKKLMSEFAVLSQETK